jgi:GDP-mannose 6-dehydrogenase
VTELSFVCVGTPSQDNGNLDLTFIQRVCEQIGRLLKCKSEPPLIRTDLETAEMVNYVDNSRHAPKIGFANEIRNLSKSLSINAHEVMKI